ncbi:MAG: oligosaccharide flippase family protein [Oscillospiraceae bacterium]|nr:oligosaccharide flippase family protein [Oscillospiraceae bacterium]
MNRIVKNTAMLYIMNIAKLVFPLLTLPYLARVLSTEANAVYTYVKNSVLMYVQLIIDFGFLLSATRAIAQAQGDRDKIGSIVGDVMVGKGLLSLLAFAVLAVMTMTIDILGNNPLYTFLSFLQAVSTIFLVDFLFHGLERMHVITIRYFITRLITVALTFLLIKDDSDLLLIPVLEILGNLAAVVWVWWEIRKLQIKVKFTKLSRVFAYLKESFVYFLSDMASTAFGALNTLIIGIVMAEKDIVIWGYAIQFVSVVQMMYNPIVNGIYPHMVREKSFGVIKKVLLVFLPLVAVGCVIVWFGADLLVSILTGGIYPETAPVLRYFIPLLFISFPAILFGWPVLGAIGKTKETTATTIICAAVQVLGLVVLLWLDRFSLFNLAMLRAATDLLMFLLRGAVCVKHRKEFLS